MFGSSGVLVEYSWNFQGYIGIHYTVNKVLIADGSNFPIVSFHPLWKLTSSLFANVEMCDGILCCWFSESTWIQWRRYGIPLHGNKSHSLTHNHFDSMSFNYRIIAGALVTLRLRRKEEAGIQRAWHFPLNSYTYIHSCRSVSESAKAQKLWFPWRLLSLQDWL